MTIEKAKAYYTGKGAPQRLNCAQAVLAAFKEKFSLSEGIIAEYSACGGGRAPGGLCGALYAAKTLLQKDFPNAYAACEQKYLDLAGATECSQIRANRKLSCVGCVELAASELQQINKKD